jgi:DNA-binding beta-propeller fold protein YncE
MLKRLTCLAMLALTAAHAQQDGGSTADPAARDAKLRALVEAAPPLPHRRVDITLSPPQSLASISAVAADAAGNLLILQRGTEAPPIIVANPEGRVLRSFGEGLFRRPHSIRVDSNGNIWTVDSNTSMVYSFEPTGRTRLTIDVGNVPDPSNPSCAAADIAIADDGRIYVADGYCNARIVVYGADGSKLKEWGRPGTGPGEFNLPHAIALSPEGNVYVADRENGRVQWFSPEGEYRGVLDLGGRIVGIDFSPAGELFVSAEPKGAPPQEQAVVLQLDRESGKVLGKIADFGHELRVGSDGTLLPASLGDRITIYRPR